METKALIVGLVVTLGVFALKAGTGFGYLAHSRKGRKAASVAVAYAAFMGLVFWGSYRLGESGSSLPGSGVFQILATYGMYLHFLLGAGLFLWGILILSTETQAPLSLPQTAEQDTDPRHRSPGKGTKGWWLLSLPCPVCLTVIVLDVYLFTTLFPEDPWRSLLLPYVTFVSITGAATLLAAGLLRKSRISPEHFVGWTLILCAFYFAMNVLVLPHFSEAKAVYGLDLNRQALSASGAVSLFGGPLPRKGILLYFVGGLFTAGALGEKLRVKRSLP